MAKNNRKHLRDKLSAFLTTEADLIKNQVIDDIDMDEAMEYHNSANQRLDDVSVDEQEINRHKLSDKYQDLEEKKELSRLNQLTELTDSLPITKYVSRLDEVDFNFTQPLNKRFAFAAPPELIDIVKDIAWFERIEMRELYIEAIKDLVMKFEKEKGLIRKRPVNVKINKHTSIQTGYRNTPSDSDDVD